MHLAEVGSAPSPSVPRGHSGAGRSPTFSHNVARVMRLLILFVNESADLRHIYTMSLESAGFRARVAGDGFEAAVCLSAERPSVIVTERPAYLVGGTELVHELRRGLAAGVPIVIATSRPERPLDAWDALPAAACLRFPIPIRELVGVVRRILGRHDVPAPLPSLNW
jgi:DNA-binding response OmpR family regulator